MKIYVDTVTKELVLNNGIEYRYPAYCEIQRQKQGDFIIIKTTNNVAVLDKTIYSDLTRRGRNGLRKFCSFKNGFGFLL